MRLIISYDEIRDGEKTDMAARLIAGTRGTVEDNADRRTVTVSVCQKVELVIAARLAQRFLK
jgi:hypothetical protein